LVPEPYFNEPGYEAMVGTEKGKHYSKSYNEDILLNTIVHAMVAQLKRPSPGFEDVIRAHFQIKKKCILKVWGYIVYSLCRLIRCPEHLIGRR
jgi:hypothetical protein